MQAEIEALTRALEAPQRPLAALVGGAKISTKIELLGNLVAKVDFLVIGGGMANTFLAAQGKNVGKSLCEKEMLGTAREILAKAKSGKCRIVLPVDVVVAKKFAAFAPSQVVSVDDVEGRRHDPRHRPARDRAVHRHAGAGQDAGVERAHGRASRSSRSIPALWRWPRRRRN